MIEHVASILSLGVAFSIVCRAVKMDSSTLPAIRHTFAAQGIAAFAWGLLPWVWPQSFEWCAAAMLAATVAVQWSTARYWSKGQPDILRMQR